MGGTAEAAGGAGAPARRRQARGQKRIEEILRAAAEVFGEQGYDATTTNAIAARAGISPGSLYQFFANKDDVARALAERYAARLATLRAELDTVARDGRDLDELVAAVLDPLVAFNLAHPGFKALFARTDMPAGLREAVAPVHAAIHGRVAELVGQLLPGRPADEVARVATVSIQLVRGMIPLITGAAGEREREVMTGELHVVVVSYLRRQTAGAGEPGRA
ncbi:TetR/AcrR family transcriptional regulator [Myceligenerans pegani]|uniref:TetR/AcrR family transcriptional regulator n=1 Tax=Myceligenerans pegani TaxID=2776917 RepID=A0ABR9MVV2_9MICO|nr:TetR/AcrR family transcriptional regulator [Myceligenerans sp. TRM 65318]MBE1875517.1 TetR/AcrR family transcriptional regulator [Myceligenerans sp. TRM 65318]MBE3017788.1 TetR/AcrR family transcriptional regulator [Myceligenerans sp. TRM 65318]